MKIKNIIIMALFGLFSCQSVKKDINSNIILFDNFEDNTNGWVDLGKDNPTLLQKIDNGNLYLESSTPEMGVISMISIDIDDSKDFTIESRLKIANKGDVGYTTMDFGILKQQPGTRNINGKDIPTTFGDMNYYFGYSDEKEVLIAKWEKGEETYYFRGNDDIIRIDDYNKLMIIKSGNSISYSINDKVLFKQKFKKLMGNSLGFATAPNAKVWVDYVKVIN